MASVKDYRNLALSFPEVEESPHFERVAFKVRKKVFTTLQEDKAIAVVKLNEIDQSAFCAYDSSIVYPVMSAWGKKGWTEIRIDRVP